MAEKNTSAGQGINWDQTWGSREFVENWITKGGWQRPIREVQTAMALRMIPQPIDQPIRVLDLGAGYGALAVAVLQRPTQGKRGLRRRLRSDAHARPRAQSRPKGSH